MIQREVDKPIDRDKILTRQTLLITALVLPAKDLRKCRAWLIVKIIFNEHYLYQCSVMFQIFFI
jgi:hypothetical protein